MPNTTTLAGHTVGRMGYGLMQLTWTPQIPPQEVSFEAMKAAADAGCTAWSTATFYGQPGDPLANVKLIAAFFEKYPEYKDKICLILKGCINAEKLMPVSDIDTYRKEIQEVQKIWGDKKIDVYSPARIAPNVEIEEPFKLIKQLIDEGLVGAAGVSELSAASLERVSKIVDIACIEIEVSLWSYEQDIKDAIAWSSKNKVPILAYSPLGRGFLTRTYKSPEDIPEGSYLQRCPRFQGDAFYQNLKIVDQLDAIAEKKGVQPSELALAWVIGLSDYTVPIPGSSKPDRVRSNAKAAEIKLSDEELKGINEILASFEPAGGRYAEEQKAVLMR